KQRGHLRPRTSPKALQKRRELDWPVSHDFQHASETLLDRPNLGVAAKANQFAALARRPPWLWPSIAAAVFLAGLFRAWAGGAFKIKTKNGPTLLENLPDKAEVFVDDDRVTLQWPESGGPIEITVPAGRRGVQVKKNGFKTFGQEVQVEAGKNAEV